MRNCDITIDDVGKGSVLFGWTVAGRCDDTILRETVTSFSARPADRITLRRREGGRTRVLEVAICRSFTPAERYAFLCGMLAGAGRHAATGRGRLH